MIRASILKGLLSLLLLNWACWASAQSEPAYRVEVIVFASLDGLSDERRLAEPARYAVHPDPRAHARAAAWQKPESDLPRLDEEARSRADALALIDAIDALESGRRRTDAPFRGGPVYPPPWQQLGALSGDMARAWQRLSDSAVHLPLAWRAWHQPLSASSRSRWMRISDQQLIDLDWLQAEAIAPEFLQQGPPWPWRLPEAAFRLDGQLRIRQRQFTHADLELVWQAPVASDPLPLASERWQPAGWLSHQLSQSRTIQLGRLEYFDSSWLGVLVRIEAWRSPLLPPSPDESSAP